MKQIDRTCYCKRRYDSVESVSNAIRNSGARVQLYYYKCKVGGTIHYHMSHKKLRSGRLPI